MPRFSLLFLLSLLLSPAVLSKNLLVEVHCFRPAHHSSIIRQHFLLCPHPLPCERTQWAYKMTHDQPLGACAGNTTRDDNLSHRLEITNISRHLSVTAWFVVRDGIAVDRRVTALVSFDLSHVRSWPVNVMTPLPESYELRSKNASVQRLQLRAAWPGPVEAVGAMTTAATLPPTTAGGASLIQSIGLWVGGFGLAALLIIGVIAAAVMCRRKRQASLSGAGTSGGGTEANLRAVIEQRSCQVVVPAPKLREEYTYQEEEENGREWPQEDVYEELTEIYSQTDECAASPNKATVRFFTRR